jgi:hypothetical protein
MATIITPSAADSSVSRGLPRIPARLVLFRSGCAPMATSAGWLLVILEDLLTASNLWQSMTHCK